MNKLYIYTIASAVVISLGGVLGIAISNALKSVVPSDVRLEIGNEDICSGVYIGDGKIISAGHCAVPNTAIVVKTKDGQTANATVKWADHNFDISEMVVDKPIKLGPASLRCEGFLPVGSEISAYGQPLGEQFIVTHGVIAGDHRATGDWKDTYPVDMTILPGQSGGPDITRDGDVVGISVGVSSYQMGVTGLAWIVPSKDVCDLIEKNDK